MGSGFQALGQPDSSWERMGHSRVCFGGEGETCTGPQGIWKGRVKGREAQGWKRDSVGLAGFQKTLCNQPEKHI